MFAHKACPGVWLIYLVTHHWRKLTFPFLAGINCTKKSSWFPTRSFNPTDELSSGRKVLLTLEEEKGNQQYYGVTNPKSLL